MDFQTDETTIYCGLEAARDAGLKSVGIDLSATYCENAKSNFLKNCSSKPIDKQCVFWYNIYISQSQRWF